MKTILTCIIILFTLSGCKKEFLDIKPDDSLVVPQSLTDFQALLDNEEMMNGFRQSGPNTGLIFAGSDEYYLPETRYNSAAFQYVRNAYVWENNNLFAGLGNRAVSDWSAPYRTVYYTNVVLEGLKNIAVTSSNTNDYNTVKGSALFYRAYAFYQLAQAFAQPYQPSTATTDYGIPLRLLPDVNEQTSRASVQQTYDQIVKDLSEAFALLPDKPLFNTRPSKPSVYALFARMYLGMERYDDALENASNCIVAHSNLVDFNTLVASASFPMPAMIQNQEVILSGTVQLDPLGSLLVNGTYALIDSTLYPLYKEGDLRKTVYFKAGTLPRSQQFKGSYVKSSLPFAGLATDEQYLIKAECFARKDNVLDAMNTLNTLLKTRWKNGSFVPMSASSPEEALILILTERRKELLMRGTRWSDLKRLNNDSRFAKTLYRNVNGKQYSLPANDHRYTWQIPDDVIGFNPGMPQNPK